MKFGMTVTKRKGTGIAVVDSRPIVNSVSSLIILKVTIVDTIWIFIHKLKTGRCAEPGVKVGIFSEEGESSIIAWS
jgi:hypothetical protein